jgi:hypothetical protein
MAHITIWYEAGDENDRAVADRIQAALSNLEDPDFPDVDVNVEVYF